MKSLVIIMILAVLSSEILLPRGNGKTVRKRLLRFIEGGYQALDDLPKKHHISPRAVSETRAKKIVALKGVYKRVGADQVKILENQKKPPPEN